MYVPIVIAVVIISCCVNVVFLEAIIKLAPGSGNLITFAQFLFVSVEGFFFTSNLCRKSPVIPISKYVSLVILFFLVSVANNYALNFNISVPLHIIFRSGSLLANMVLGIIILKRSYSIIKYISVAIITLGIIMATLSSSQHKTSTVAGDAKESSLNDFVIGVSLLTFALLASARCGIFQEVLFTTYGKHAKEALFYTHVLSLPGFILLLPDIYHQAIIFHTSIPLAPLYIPRLWFYLAINMVTQYCCIRSVLVLMTECTSLTVTLVITIRKFVSLVFSIIYFDNTFTIYHWSATLMVFFGTFLFLDLPALNDWFNHISAFTLSALNIKVKIYEKLSTDESGVNVEPKDYFKIEKSGGDANQKS